MGNTYELLAVRYREKEEDGIMRREFIPDEKVEAEAFEKDLKEKGYSFVEMTTVVARRS
ncbi:MULTISPECIES: hypothetical protein [unclassified Bacillus (in: firmicutes)]|uniref:hypothetical protein n=1 Tax=unclassified Bacillus (in: firmicutes) TaxID=185979 RepID=UPI00300FFA84